MPIVVKKVNQYCYIVHNVCLKLLVFILWFFFNKNYMLISILIFKVFYIFVLYFQVLLSIIEISLVKTYFYGTGHQRVIITASCPRGGNMRNP